MPGIAIVPALGGLQFDRPIMVTHAGDNSKRLFVVGQRGLIHVVADRDQPKPEVFLDIRPKVRYIEKENEEGLLGLAFHPRFADNGQLFIYYTASDKPKRSIISRFQVDSKKTSRVDPDSEEVLLEIEQPFWNHNGGTLIFGPDGYLYIGLGDGGKAHDPFSHGQNPRTWLGSILRIDVDYRQNGKAYGIPSDNPFAQCPDAGRPEVWAYGLRNVWRMAFDRTTGQLWCADVGQDTWEEINIIRRGGNYGWNFREGRHSFRPLKNVARVTTIEPVWEYHHRVGKSIIGGSVYRGRQLPRLVGKYLYADYITGTIWALDYDARHGRVCANYILQDKGMPILSFSEDELGEVFFTTTANQVFQLAPAIQDE